VSTQLWRKKLIAVEARQVVSPELVNTAHGRVRAEVGDWVLRDPTTGDTWPIKPDIFAATYESAETVPPAPPSDEAVARALFKARGRHGEFFVGGPASNECLDDVRAVRAAEREAAR